MLHEFDKNRDSLINFMIITGCHKTLKETCEAKREDGKFDIVMTVNGVEMDLQHFMDRWQGNVDRLVEEKAKEIIREKFPDLDDSVYELQELVSSFETKVGNLIKKKIETWEKKDEV